MRIALTLSIALSLAPRASLACDRLASATPASECIAIVPSPVGSAPGVWLSVRSADVQSKAYAENPSLKSALVEMAAANSARLRQVEEMRAADSARATALRDATEEIASLSAWYRSPYLWFIAGAVIAGGGATIIVLR